MQTFLNILVDFGLTFVPLFVARDAIGVLPVYIPLMLNCDGSKKDTRRHCCHHGSGYRYEGV